MKNPKFLLYALCFGFISFLNACHKDSTISETAEVQITTLSNSSSGLTERSSALQMPSGHFTTLRYTSSGVRSFPTGNVNLVWTANAANTTIQFSSRTQLATVISTPSGSQAHHIIPWQWVDDFGGSASLLQNTVKAAAYAGFHPNNTYNGTNIPNTLHNGSHPQFSNYVRFQLDAWLLNNTLNTSFINIGECQVANTWIQCKLIPHLRTHLNAMVSQNKNINVYFTATFPARTYIGN